VKSSVGTEAKGNPHPELNARDKSNAAWAKIKKQSDYLFS